MQYSILIKHLPAIGLMLFGQLLALYTSATYASSTSGSTVIIVDQGGSPSLLVNGEPFTVKGAGMGYTREDGIRSLAKAGGNAFRTWDTASLDEQLAAAEKHGLMVLVGLDVGKQLQGFDYTDVKAVSDQHVRLMGIVSKYRTHPNVLGWILGNEPNLMVDASGAVVPADSLVYSAIGRLAADIKALDPDHPSTMAFAFTPTLAEDISAALEAIPDLDFVSLQAYGALPVLPQLAQELDLPIPYMITEYGPLGHWEMPATEWGREIEEPSGHKAKGMRGRMNGSVIDEPSGQMIGSFAFLWGQKQERTPTWYGLFLESGERTASVDELTHVWTDSWPENRAPSAWSISLEGQAPTDSVKVKAGQPLNADAIINDPENDELAIRWQLLGEVDERSHGGHFERTPDSIDLNNANQLVEGESHQIRFDAPSQPGEYRLFVYAMDEKGGAATANIPFMVVD